MDLKSKRFKKGELSQEAYDVIMHDLGCLDLRASPENNEYHYELLKANIKDIFGGE